MSDWISLVESAYHLEGGLDDWVARIRDAAGPVFDRGMGVAVHTFRVQADSIRTESVATWAGPPDFDEIIRAANREAPPEAISHFLGWGTRVSTMSEAVFSADPKEHERFMSSTRSAQRDVLGVVVRTGEGRGLSISIPIPEFRSPTPQERRDLGRVGAHLAAGMRLRAALSDSPDAVQGKDREGEAVLDPQGRLHEARGAAAAEDPRQRLRDAVLQLETARSASKRLDPDALGLWQGLVRGRWSLVDRFDSDGRRFIVAHRNEPQLGEGRGLSPREHQVAEHVGAGGSNKEIAYEFGISESAVANAVSRAQRKLGLGSRIELGRFFAPGGLRSRLISFEFAGERFAAATAAIVDEELLAPLRPAERDVALQLLRGATNAEIARQRGTSTNTVANQVQSIFARLGVRSRVGLAARVGAGR